MSPAEEAALLRASSAANMPRPAKETAIVARLRHTDAVEVFRSKGKGAEVFSHWAPLTVWGLCGHTCADSKLCNNNVGNCRAHSRREEELLACEDSRSTIVERGVCGVPEAGGGTCQKPWGQCSVHTAAWHQERELRALRAEDDASCIADRGRCGVVPRGGGDACGHPRTRCPFRTLSQRQFRELWRFRKIAAHLHQRTARTLPNPHIRTLAPAPAPHRYVKWVCRLCFRSTRLDSFPAHQSRFREFSRSGKFAGAGLSLDSGVVRHPRVLHQISSKIVKVAAVWQTESTVMSSTL